MKNQHNSSNIILYRSPKGSVSVEVVYSHETFWLTQKRMSELFGVAVPAVSKHLKNIFDTGELQENSVVSILETTAADGKNYQTAFYSLDAVIAVGYRVNSLQATQFRIWAAEVIFNRADAEKEFMGLMTFSGVQPHLKDVIVAKNYLNEKELRALGQIVSGYLDFAERQAERQATMTMKDWATHLDRILTMSGENCCKILEA